MLSSYGQATYKRALHDLTNSLSVIYGSMCVIQLQHPEVCDYKYWSETMTDLETVKETLINYSSAFPKENT